MSALSKKIALMILLVLIILLVYDLTNDPFRDSYQDPEIAALNEMLTDLRILSDGVVEFAAKNGGKLPKKISALFPEYVELLDFYFSAEQSIPLNEIGSSTDLTSQRLFIDQHFTYELVEDLPQGLVLIYGRLDLESNGPDSEWIVY